LDIFTDSQEKPHNTWKTSTQEKPDISWHEANVCKKIRSSIFLEINRGEQYRAD
jgi:hypothetical protein